MWKDYRCKFNTQVPRYLIFLDGGNFIAHTLTMVSWMVTSFNSIKIKVYSTYGIYAFKNTAKL